MTKQKKRRTRGEGTIRQRKDGTWEARFVVGVDPGTGRDIRKSVYARTQKEVRQKMTEALAALDRDDYREPCKMTLGQWLDVWTAEYMGDIKPRTVESYLCQIRNHIRPALGAVRLEALNTHTIQQFYNDMSKDGLSPKTVKIVHGVLHKALGQAVLNGYLRSNPTDACILPRMTRKEIKPLDADATAQFMAAIRGHRFETVYLVTLFTGMRQGEVLGLTWDCVDFDHGTITINKQLQKDPNSRSDYRLVQTKTSNVRQITPAPYVMDVLRSQKRKQAEWQLKAGPVWQNGDDLVFTNEAGGHLTHRTTFRDFKKIVVSIGLPNTRFHDLRHTYAVAALASGDDIKTVQSTLGHSDATTTLNIYAHVTEQMKRDSADRMQQYIDSIKKNA